MTPARRDFAICLVLAIVVAAVFGRTVGFGYVELDDPLYLAEVPPVQAGLTWSGLRWAFTTPVNSNWHPLTMLSYMAVVQAFGPGAAAQHALNVALHAFAAIALYMALNRMTDRPWLCAWVALLFAVHPLRVESVAWVSERKDVLFAIFFFLAIDAHARYVHRPRLAVYLLSLLLFALSLMSKPMAVTLPPLLLLLDIWPLRRWRSGARWWRPIAEILPFFALSVLDSLVTVHVQGTTMSSMVRLPLTARLSVALTGTIRYLGKLILPMDLSAFYPLRPVPTFDVVVAICLLTVITIACAAACRRRPYLLVGWSWFCLTLLPVIGLIQVGTQSIADRYTYIPSVGIFLAIIWGISDAIGVTADASLRLRLRRAAILGGSALVAVYSIASWVQTDYWRDGTRLFTRVLDVTGPSAEAYNGLAGALQAAGDFPTAAACYAQALQLDPQNIAAHVNLGGLLLVSNPTAAEQHARAAISMNGDVARPYVLLWAALTEQRRNSEAAAALEKAERLDPTTTDSVRQAYAVTVSAHLQIAQ